MDVPTGNTGEIVRQYYHYLYSHFLGKLTQQYYIHWDVLAAFALWVFVLAAAIFAYTRWQHRTHAEKEPYPVESYDGYLQEGNGPVGTFLTLFYIGMFIWLVVITVGDLLNGQIY